MISILKRYGQGLFDLILPDTCMVCGRQLVPMEKVCCTACTIDMPFTHYKGCEGNPIERMFWGKIPIVHANAYLHYYPHTAYAQLIKELKYNNRPNIGIYLGRLIATDLLDTNFFKDIDYIIPVPLALIRQLSRGYNQSERIAKGVQQITKIPIDTKSVQRKRGNKKQTKTHKTERHENVKDIFSLTIACEANKQVNLSPLQNLIPIKKEIKTTSHPLENKHILLVDDVITTGATLLSCAKALAVIPGIRISILCAGVAGYKRWGPRKPD